MIRFVDMRKSDIAGVRFSFWDTVIDAFVEVGGEQAWDTWDELLETSDSVDGVGPDLERLRRLCPDWTFIIDEVDYLRW